MVQIYIIIYKAMHSSVSMQIIEHSSEANSYLLLTKRQESGTYKVESDSTSTTTVGWSYNPIAIHENYKENVHSNISSQLRNWYLSN